MATAAANPLDEYDAKPAAGAGGNPLDEYDPKTPAAINAEAEKKVAADRARLNVNTGRLAVNPLAAADFVRNYARGTLPGSYLDEGLAGVSALAHKLTGGAIGSPYDEAVAYQRAQNRAADAEHPVLSTGEKLFGGATTGAPAAKAIMQGGGKVLQALKGGGLGAGYGFVYGTGEGEDTLANRLEKGGETAAITGPLGAVIPPSVDAALWGAGKVGQALTPTAARISANAKALLDRIGIKASADGSVPADTVGGRAAAEQILANQLRRAGVTADDIEAALDKAAEARQIHSSGQAQNVTALADIDPSLQRLAGSVYRRSPEAGNRIIDFLYQRQTGEVPQRGALPVAEAGLPSRERFAEPITGAQAQRQFGTDFGAGEKNLVPMGQYERVIDATKRALLIKDTDYHGHAANANRTNQQILDAASDEAKSLYGDVRDAGKGIDLRGHINPILERWDDAASSEPGPISGMLKRSINDLRRLLDSNNASTTSIERFDKWKQTMLDDRIGKLVKSGDKSAARTMTMFKNELLNGVEEDGKIVMPGVDRIEANGLGDKYQKARNVFSGHMEARRALEAGAEAAKGNADDAIDAFRALGDNKGNQKLFRLGYVGAIEDKYGAMPRSTDVTKFFESPNAQKVLAEIIPHDRGALRFGRYLASERQMTSTPRQVIGGSPTQQREADDEAFDAMNTFIEQFKNHPTDVKGAALRVLETAASKIFGYRADTAAALGRMLFTANPVERQRVLTAIRERMGGDRFGQFAEVMKSLSRSATPSATGAASSSGGELGSPSNPHRVVSEAEVNRLEPGSHFIAPDGSVKVKP